MVFHEVWDEFVFWCTELNIWSLQITVTLFCFWNESKAYEMCRYPQHEEEVGQLARELGFTHVSLSSAIMPMARIVPRGFTGQFYQRYSDINKAVQH